MSKKIDKFRLLRLFTEEPQRQYNVREAGRLAGIMPTTSSKYLKELCKDGFLTVKQERHMTLYSADTDGHAFRDFKIYSNIKKIRSSGLVEFIENSLNYPETIILFGSYAKGENTRGSDIDLFILSESRKGLDTARLEKRLGAKIQLFICGRQELENMKIKNRGLLNNIINGIRLSGFFEVLR